MASCAVLCGAGGWVPPGTVTNDDLARVLDTSDEWIRTRTGIAERRVAGPGMPTSVLAEHAGRRALASAGLDAVDAVVVATSTPDRSCPATAPVVAARLGLSGVPAFDVSAVCSGFVYALVVASGLVTGHGTGSVLVVGADTFSTILDPACRSTRAIFGDGAGAVVLRPGTGAEPGALLGFDLGSDGSGADLITVPGGGSEDRTTAGPAASPYFTMDGQAVFGRAVRGLAASASSVLDDVGWAAATVDLFVAHQANLRILRSTAARLSVAEDRVFVDLDRFGNTAGASVPLALADAAARGVLTAGDRVLISAFGGGLTWGSAAFRWPDLAVAPVADPAGTTDLTALAAS